MTTKWKLIFIGHYKNIAKALEKDKALLEGIDSKKVYFTGVNLQKIFFYGAIKK